MRTIASLLLILVAASCDNLRRAAEELLDHRPPRERYVDALGNAGLRATALAQDWIEAGERALRGASVVTPPYEEYGYLTPSEPAAIALRVAVRRGQEVSLVMDLPGDTTTTLFLDAWSVSTDSSGVLLPLSAADSGLRQLSVTPRRDGDVVFRVQPELLRGGRFRVTLRIAPTLAFPVKSGTERDIGSRFGAPRDAGARSHHGIDIFAKRGTPVVAAATGVVNRVEQTNIGGKVVWLRDIFGNSLYYAHLDSQTVTRGDRVGLGDTLGFVGNTGNARTTPPHLHFGVYQRGQGPVDPYWFVYRSRGVVARLVADTNRLGDLVRALNDRVILRASPGVTADTLIRLEAKSAMRVVSASSDWYRVRLPDGVIGFVAARSIEPTDRVLGTLSLSGTILARPRPDYSPGDVMGVVASGEVVDVLGRFGDYTLIRSTRRISGWVLQP